MSLYYITHKVFKSHFKPSQADFNHELPVAISYQKLNCQLFWEPRYIALAWTRITGNTSRDRLLLCDITANHRKHMSHDPYTLLCDVTAHALYSNSLCVDVKKTLPQYCCVACVLERV
jgi:hypothetical protein